MFQKHIENQIKHIKHTHTHKHWRIEQLHLLINIKTTDANFLLFFYHLGTKFISEKFF